MRPLLRTVWKDMVILRWWLLAWVMALGAFAVWRDQAAAAAWDSASTSAKPDLPDMILPALLGFAAVVAVRFMQTDDLHRPLAFWRTRPTSGFRLGMAKLPPALLWLIALPAAVEFALLKHWNWDPWLWPCVADWTIRFASVVLPALAISGVSAGRYGTIPLALLLAWLCYQQRPAALMTYHRFIDTPSPELPAAFLTFYARCLLAPAAVLMAASGGRWRQAAAFIVVIGCFSFPQSTTLTLAPSLDPIAPSYTERAMACEVSTLGSNGYPEILAEFPGSDDACWITPAPRAAAHLFQESSATFPLLSGAHFSSPPARDDGLLLGRAPFLTTIGIGPPDPLVKKADGIELPVEYGSWSAPIICELPLTNGASWSQGPWRIELERVLRSTDSRQGVLFQLRTSGPFFALGKWHPSLHGGTGAFTAWRSYLVNRRLRVCLPLDWDNFPGNNTGFDVTQKERNDTHALRPDSAALHRFDRQTWFYLDSFHCRLPGQETEDMNRILPILLEGAVFATVEWRLEKHGVRTLTAAPWPPVPQIMRDYRSQGLQWKDIQARLAALKLPPLDDEDLVRRYIDECIRLFEFIGKRGQSEDGTSVYTEMHRLSSLGSPHFPLIVRRMIASTTMSSPWSATMDYWTRRLDSLALEMAGEEHREFLTALMRRGVFLTNTMKKLPWLRDAALPLLEDAAANYQLSHTWAATIAAIDDPRARSAFLTWCRRSEPEAMRYALLKLRTVPAAPWKEAMEVLHSRWPELDLPSRAIVALVAAAGGTAWGPSEAARCFADWPWPGDHAGYTDGSFSDYLALLRPVCPACPADDKEALHWLAAHGKELKWNGSAWQLP